MFVFINGEGRRKQEALDGQGATKTYGCASGISDKLKTNVAKSPRKFSLQGKFYINDTPRMGEEHQDGFDSHQHMSIHPGITGDDKGPVNIIVRCFETGFRPWHSATTRHQQVC